MTKVGRRRSTEDGTPAPTRQRLLPMHGRTVPQPRPTAHFIVEFYRSAIGKKWVMAISGIILLGYVLAHMVGNLKVFLGEEDINLYAEWLRELGEPALPAHVAALDACASC